MQSSSKERDFSAYNAAQAGRPVRPLAVRAVEASDAAEPGPSRRTAVELGCGIGIEARYLAEHRYDVWTYDTDPGVEPALRDLGCRHPVNHTTTALESIDQLPVADLLLSCATLSFVPRAGFDHLWRAITRAVRPGGVLAIDLSGERDDWAHTDGTFLTRTELDELLQDWSGAEIEEKEFDGRSFSGPKHWHTFTVLARR